MYNPRAGSINQPIGVQRHGIQHATISKRTRSVAGRTAQYAATDVGPRLFGFFDFRGNTRQFLNLDGGDDVKRAWLCVVGSHQAHTHTPMFVYVHVHELE